MRPPLVVEPGRRSVGTSRLAVGRYELSRGIAKRAVPRSHWHLRQGWLSASCAGELPEAKHVTNMVWPRLEFNPSASTRSPFSADYYAVPVLYPLTESGFDGIAWITPWFMVLNYTALAAVGAWLLMSSRRPDGG